MTSPIKQTCEVCTLHQQVTEDFHEVFERLRAVEKAQAVIENNQTLHGASIKDVSTKVDAIRTKLLIAAGVAAGIGAMVGGELGTIILKALKSVL